MKKLGPYILLKVGTKATKGDKIIQESLINKIGFNKNKRC